MRVGTPSVAKDRGNNNFGIFPLIQPSPLRGEGSSGEVVILAIRNLAVSPIFAAARVDED